MNFREKQNCECCGKSEAEMKPHGFVVKMRPMVPPNSICRKSRKIYDEYFQDCEDPMEASDVMVKKLGDEKASQIQFEVHVAGNTMSSNECKDCASLDDNEFHEKLEVSNLK